MVTIHRQLFRIVKANIPGLCADLDIEYLHDFRVALRKTRTAIACVPRVLPPHPSVDFKKELRWLFRATGGLRDLDVFLTTMIRQSDLQKSRFDLGPILDHFRVERQSLQKDVQRLLTSERTQRLLDQWIQYLSHGYSHLPPARRSDAPILKVARKVLVRRWRRVQKEAVQMGPGSPDSALHQLRVEIKKLRYLLDFFKGLFPNGSSAVLVLLKQLQDSLGACSDVCAQIDTLACFLDLETPETTISNTTTQQTRLLVAELEERGSTSRRIALSQLQKATSGPLIELMQVTLANS